MPVFACYAAGMATDTAGLIKIERSLHGISLKKFSSDVDAFFSHGLIMCWSSGVMGYELF
jgi:hypothetical protein